MDVRARIIYDSTPGDIINQFVTFARVFDQQILKCGRNREAVEETLRICKDQDVLKKYLEETEASEIMFTWLDEQKAKKFEEEEIRIEESVHIYRDEMNMDSNSIIARLQEKFNLSPQTAEKYVLVDK